MKNITKGDVYYLEKSYVDEKENCIRIPVSISTIDNHNIYDPTKFMYLFAEVEKKYAKLSFSGKWNSFNEGEEVKELLLFFEPKVDD